MPDTYNVPAGRVLTLQISAKPKLAGNEIMYKPLLQHYMAHNCLQDRHLLFSSNVSLMLEQMHWCCVRTTFAQLHCMLMQL
jgi:hypothetical protein